MTIVRHVYKKSKIRMRERERESAFFSFRAT